MDSKIESELKKAKGLLGKVSRIMNLLGVWPVEKTRFQQIRFITFMIYASLHVSMTINNLVANITNAKLVTFIIQQLLGIGMTFNRLIFINLSSGVKEIIIETKKEIAGAALSDITEKKIFIKLHEVASLYFRLTFRSMIFTSCFFFVMSFYNIISAYNAGRPIAMLLPYKVKFFFLNTSSVERSFLLFIYETPVFLMQPNYCATVNMQVIIIINLAAQLAILAQRIRNLDLKESSESSNLMIQKIVLRHLELVKLAKKIESTWSPIYCLEFGMLIPLISIVIYNAMSFLNNNQKVFSFLNSVYIIVTLMSLFGHCLMGEILKNQSDNLMDAYYNCNWCEMPIKYKKSILICITYTKITLNISAGKFFNYSFNAFTGMLKSILAYVSLLREVAL